MTQKQREKRSGFVGVWPLAKRFIYGAQAVQSPKLKSYGQSVTPNPSADSNTNYEGMKPEAYRWFRQDELVRRCIVVNAAYAMMATGFETELEPLQKMGSEEEQAFQLKYKPIKDYVDAANRIVNLDRCLFVAQVKRSVFGKSGFEIEYDSNGAPNWLLSVDSRYIKPDVNENWLLVGYKYNEEPKWKLIEDRFLYFANLDLENDREGLSEVEPVNIVCKARHNILRRDLPEITRCLWAPYAVLSADTSGMTATAEDAFLDSLIEAAKSGKSIVINKSVTATVVDIKVNMMGLVALLEKLEEAIIRNFGTPRFLVNKPNENRATSYTEFEAYIGGTIANIQRYFKRELEAQWYPILVKLALKKEGESGTVPLRVRHVWNPIRSTDVYDMANAVSALYGNGLGVLADYPEIAFDMMGWEKALLLEHQEQQQPQTEKPKNPNKNNPETGLPGEENVDGAKP